MSALIRDIYRDIYSNMTNSNLWKSHIWEGPSQSDISSWQSQGYGVYQGKIRTVLSRDGRIQMIDSDRLTAFDRHIDYVPLKGVLLTSISRFWFEQLTGIVPTHFIQQIGSRVLLVENLNPIKIEVIVRQYLAGSMLKAYEQGQRIFCGIKLPEGLKAYSKLPEPLITPTTKAAAFEHDENITVDDLITHKICTASEWDAITALSLKVFSIGSKIYGEKGWILVDTKYEFGRNREGMIKLIDEVHTPDCSRLWIKETYEPNILAHKPPEMLDKQMVRQWLSEQGFSGHGSVPIVPRTLLIDLARTYLNVAEKLWGRPLTESL